jgi:hypothetical protein
MQKVNSQWKGNTKSTIIDGKADDWDQSLVFFEKENLLIGTRNDKDNLYLCIKSNDRDVARKIFMAGFTIWLNDEANKSETIGIHYPIGMMIRGRMSNNMERSSEDYKASSKMDKENNRTESMLQDMEILKGEDKEHFPISLIESSKKYGITAKIINDDDIMTYEITIPLSADLMGLKLNNNKEMKIGVGFESGEFKKPDFGGMSLKKGGMPPMGDGGNSAGGMPPIGGRGGMRRGDGGNGGRMNSDKKAMHEPIQLWLELKLAEK